MSIYTQWNNEYCDETSVIIESGTIIWNFF